MNVIDDFHNSFITGFCDLGHFSQVLLPSAKLNPLIYNVSKIQKFKKL